LGPVHTLIFASRYPANTKAELEEIGVIKLINYLRLEAQKGIPPSSILITPEALSGDQYLAPALPDDPVLFELGDFMPESADQVKDYSEYEAALSKNLPDGDIEMIDAGNDRDELYFDSYKGNSIHREMIEDKIRTEGYMDFITKYAHLFKDKVVLDVGCGTSILSMFCARAGAKKVFAVDNSGIANRAKEIVAKNGYADRIEVIQGRVEDFATKSKISGKVDIIISEWMGYGLLFEGMLDSVLRARDMYLAPGGLMVPSHCTLRLAPISDKEWIAESTGEKFWKDIYGFDFSPMIPGGHLNEREICVFDVPAKAICGSASTFYEIDIANITVEQLDFTAPFESTLAKYAQHLDAFAIWFDTYFLPPGVKADLKDEDALSWENDAGNGTAFSTGPFGTSTHWHQAVLLLSDEERRKHLKAGSTLKGTVTYKKPKRDARAVEVDITWEGSGSDGHVEGKVSRTMA
jgi:protein arginine N-methyltransferase 3